MNTANRARQSNNAFAEDDLLHRLQSDQAGFARISALAGKLAGIHLPATSKNLTLVATRLSYMIRELELATYSDLARLLEKTPERHQEFISALTTNTTQFFREPSHFDILKQNLPTLIQSPHRAVGEFRIWCAASSTGQEVWTLLMTLLESPATTGLTIKFLASDIDTDCLEKAWKAIYPADQCRGIPPNLLEKYFDSAAGPNHAGVQTTYYRVKREFRSRVQFARINLVEVFPFEKRFDVVFCRNVMIYFDRTTIDKISEKMAQALRPDGLLFLGLSEAGAIRNPSFKSISPSVFKRLEMGPA